MIFCHSGLDPESGKFYLIGFLDFD